jgi:hypothetical protein
MVAADLGRKRPCGGITSMRSPALSVWAKLEKRPSAMRLTPTVRRSFSFNGEQIE